MTLPYGDPPQAGHHCTPRETRSERWRDRVGVRERGLKEEKGQKNTKIKREKKANGIKKKLFCFRIELLLHLESHCNTIPNFFGIVAFCKSGYRGYFGILC